jgi:hypothetical protein
VSIFVGMQNPMPTGRVCKSLPRLPTLRDLLLFAKQFILSATEQRSNRAKRPFPDGYWVGAPSGMNRLTGQAAIADQAGADQGADENEEGDQEKGVLQPEQIHDRSRPQGAEKDPGAHR